jgi:restriction system protein
MMLNIWGKFCWARGSVTAGAGAFEIQEMNGDRVFYCVRAGEGTANFDTFMQRGFVSIDWLPERDLSGIADKSEIRELYQRDYPQVTNARTIGQDVGCIRRFIHDLQLGHVVVTPAPEGSAFRVGTVTGHYEFHRDDRTPHRRAVNWRPSSIERAAANAELFHALNSQLAIFKIRRSGFGDRLRLALQESGGGAF